MKKAIRDGVFYVAIAAMLLMLIGFYLTAALAWAL